MTDFKFPMSIRERIMGMVYIVFHSAIIPFVLSIVYMLILSPLGVEMSDAQLNLIVYLIGFIYCVAAMFKFLRISFSDIFDAPGKFLLCAVVGFFATLALNMVVNVTLVAILGEESLVNPNSAAIDQFSGEGFRAMAAAAVILAPIVEECMFRGALFGTIRTKSRVAAYVITVVVFAIYHLWSYFVTDYSPSLWLYLLQYVPATVVLCRVYEKSGTIWCPILLHAMINGFSFLGESLLQ